MQTFIRFATRAATAVALLAAAACGKDSTAPTPPRTDVAAIASRFTLIGSRLGGIPQIGLQLAGQALTFGATPSAVTVSGSLARAVDGAVRTQIAASGTQAGYQAVGMDMVVTNLPGTVAPVHATGIVTFRDETDFTYVMTLSGPDVGAPQAFGGIAQGGSVWVAPVLSPAPTVTRLSTGAACPSLPSTLPGYTCALAQFSAQFSIVGAQPVDVTGFTMGTGTRNAALATSTINGVTLTVDASKGSFF